MRTGFLKRFVTSRIGLLMVGGLLVSGLFFLQNSKVNEQAQAKWNASVSTTSESLSQPTSSNNSQNAATNAPKQIDSAVVTEVDNEAGNGGLTEILPESTEKPEGLISAQSTFNNGDWLPFCMGVYASPNNTVVYDFWEMVDSLDTTSNPSMLDLSQVQITNSWKSTFVTDQTCSGYIPPAQALNRANIQYNLGGSYDVFGNADTCRAGSNPSICNLAAGEIILVNFRVKSKANVCSTVCNGGDVLQNTYFRMGRVGNTIWGPYYPSQACHDTINCQVPPVCSAFNLNTIPANLQPGAAVTVSGTFSLTNVTGTPQVYYTITGPGANFSKTISATGNGNYSFSDTSFTVPTGQYNATYTVTARVVGYESACQATTTFTTGGQPDFCTNLIISSPSNGAQLNPGQVVSIAGSVSGSGIAGVNVFVNGVSVPGVSFNGSSFSVNYTIPAGWDQTYVIRATAVRSNGTEFGGACAQSVTVTTGHQPETCTNLTITAPANGTVVNPGQVVAVTGSFAGVGIKGVNIYVNGQFVGRATVSGTNFSYSYTVPAGWNSNYTIRAVAVDSHDVEYANGVCDKSVTISTGNEPELCTALTLTSPADNAQVTYGQPFTISGNFAVQGISTPRVRVTVTQNGTVVKNDVVSAPGNSFSTTYTPTAYDATYVIRVVVLKDDGTEFATPCVASRTVRTGPQPTPVLSITKDTVNPDTQYHVGDNVQFTLTLRNTGNATATGVVVRDTLPAGFTYVSCSVPAGQTCTGSAQSITWNVGSLAAGSTVVATITANIGSSVVPGDNQCRIYTNTGSFTSDNGGTGSDTSDVCVIGRPNVTIVKDTVDSRSYAPGDTVQFRVTVNNSGNSTATNVVVSDTLPAGFTFVANSCQPSVGTCVLTPAFSWTVGNLAPGASATATYSALIGANVPAGNNVCINYVNTASFNSGNAGTGSDTSDVCVQGRPNLVIVKDTVDPRQYHPGDTVQFRATVSNNGTADALNVVVTDTLPTGFTFVPNSCQATVGTCTVNGTFNWNIGTLAKGVSVTATYSATIATTIDAGNNVCRNYVNTATFNSSNGGTGSDTSDICVIGVPNVHIEKVTEGSGPFYIGDIVPFRLTVWNDGSADALNVVVNDTLPAGFVFANNCRFLPTTLGTCSGNGQTVTWTVGTLPKGATHYSLIFDVTIPRDADPTRCYVNTASFAAPYTGTATAEVCPQPLPRLRFQKHTVGTTEQEIGAVVYFDLIVHNESTSDVPNPTITDALPAGFTYEQGTAQCFNINAQGQEAPITCPANTGSGQNLEWRFTSPLRGGNNLRIRFGARIGNIQPGAYWNCGAVTTTATNIPVFNEIPCSKVVVTIASAGIVKSFDPASIVPGQESVMTLRVRNNGTQSHDFLITDRIPAGIEVVLPLTPSADPSITCQPPVGGALSCTFLNLAAGAEKSVTMAVKSTSSVQNTVINCADLYLQNPSFYIDRSCAELAIVNGGLLSKVFGADRIGLGESSSMTFAVTNPFNATRTLYLQDTVVNTLGIDINSFVNAATNAPVQPVATALTGANTRYVWAIALTGRQTVTYRGTVKPTVAGAFNNCAFLYSDYNAQTKEVSNQIAQGCDDLTVNNDGLITKNFGTDRVNVGQQTTLTFNVTNPFNATRTLFVEDSIANALAPTGFNPAPVSSRVVDATHTSYIWSLTLNANETRQISMNVTPNAAGGYNNCAYLYDNQQAMGTALDNGCDDLTVTTSTPLITKVFNPRRIDLGATSQVTISATNTGTVARDVVIRDTIDPLLVPSAFSKTADTTYPQGNLYQWTFAAVPAGQTVTVTFTVTPSQARGYTNCAQLAGFTDQGCDNLTVAAATSLITKVFNPDRIVVGESSTVTITATNSTGAARDLVVRDVIDPRLVPSGFNPTPDVTYPQGSLFQWTFANVSAGQSRTITFTVTPNNAAGYTNCAQLVGSTEQGCDDLTVTGGTSLVTKSFSPDRINLGDSSTVTISATNTASAARTLVIRDTVDSRLAPTNFSVAPDATYPQGNVYQWTFTNVPGNQSRSVSFSVTPTAAAGYTNCAQLVGSNEQGCDDLTVTALTNLLTKTFAPDRIALGESSTVTISATNVSTSARTLVVRDTIDARLAPTNFNTASDAGFPQGSLYQWTFTNVPAGQVRSVTFTVTPTQAMGYTNCAQLVGTNEQGCDDLTVTFQNITVDKSASPETNRISEFTTFTITVSNNTAAPQTVDLFDELNNTNENLTYQNNVTFLGINPGSAQFYHYLPNGSLVNCSNRTSYNSCFQIGQSGRLEFRNITVPANTNGVITFRATSSVAGTYTNHVSINQPAAAGQKGAELDWAEAKVRFQSDLSVDKTVNKEKAKLGEKVTFTITVTNNGTTAHRVNIADNLWTTNSNLILAQGSITSTCANGTNPDIQGGNIVWNQFNIPANGQCIFTLDAYSNTVGTYTNRVEIRQDSNVIDWAEAKVQYRGDITISKTANKQVASLGEEVLYTVTVLNNTGAANNVDIVDDLSRNNLQFVRNNTAPFPAVNGSTLTWSNVSVPANGSTSVSFYATSNVAGEQENYVALYPAGNRTNLLDFASVKVRFTNGLSISKSVDAEQKDPNDPFTFTLTITNNGATAQQVRVVDTLPAGLTYVNNSASHVPVSTTPLTWDVTAQPGVTRVTFRAVSVTAGACVTNVVQMFQNNQLVDRSQVEACTKGAIRINKSVDAEQKGPNEPFTFTLTVNNSGITAQAVRVVDVLPAGLTYVANSANPAPASTNPLAWDITAQPGQTRITLQAVGAQGGTCYTNTAEVLQNGSRIDKSSVEACVQGTLSITKSVDAEKKAPGEDFTYTLRITNNGTQAQQVEVVDTLPAGLIYRSNSASPAAFANSPLRWNITAQPGSNTIITFRAYSDTAGVCYTNSVDLNQNNQKIGWSSVQACVQGTIDLVKSVDAEKKAPGEDFTFTLTANNSGAAQPITIVDTLPAGLVYRDGTASNNGVYNAATRTVSWSVTAGRGATAVTFRAYSDTAGACFTNTAEAQQNGNKIAWSSAQACTHGTLSVDKSVSKEKVAIGEVFTYTVTVGNTGNAVQTVTVIDTLPAGITFRGNASPTAPAQNGQVLTWNNVSVPARGSTVFTFTASADQAGTFTNYVEIRQGGVVVDWATAKVAAQGTLSIDKSVNRERVPAGDTVEFTLRVFNTGNTTITGAQVVDRYSDAGLTCVNNCVASVTGGGSVANTAPTVNLAGKTLTWDNITINPNNYNNPLVLKFQMNVAQGAHENGADLNVNGLTVDFSQQVKVVGQTAVHIVKNANPVSGISVGGTTTYTLTVTNDADNAQTYSVVDVLGDSALVYNGGANPAPSAVIGNQLIWDNITVAGKGSRTITIPVTVTETGSHINTAYVLPNTIHDITQALDFSSVTVSANSGLRITKQANPTYVSVDQPVTFTIQVRNITNAQLNNVQVRVQDPMPAGVRYITNSAQSDGGTCVFDGSALVCNYTVIPTAGRTLTFQGAASTPGSYVNVASLQQYFSGAYQTIDQATASFTVGTPLAIEKSANPSFVSVGSPTTFTMRVKNTGNVDQTGVTVRDPLPEGMFFTGTNGNCVTPVGSCRTVGRTAFFENLVIPAQSSILVTFQAYSDVAQSFTNTAILEQRGVEIGQAKADVRVGSTLSIVKNVAPAVVNVGQNTTFTITVYNNSADAATGVTVTDRLPAGLFYRGNANPVLSNVVNVGADNSTLIWDNQTIPGSVGNVPGSKTFTFEANAGAVGSYINLAKLQQNGVNLGQDTATLQVREPLTVTKTTLDPVVAPGGEVRFQINVQNNTDALVNDIEVEDILPAGFTYKNGSSQTAFGTGDPVVTFLGSQQRLVWPASGARFSISGNSSIYVRFTAVAPASGVGSYTNTSFALAYAGGTGTPRRIGPATSPVQISGTTVSVSKSVTPGSTTTGNVVRYTITAYNFGPQQQVVGLKDTLPAGFTYVGNATRNPNVVTPSNPTATDRQQVIWNEGSFTLAPYGGSAFVSFDVRVGNTQGTFLNQAVAVINGVETPPAIAPVVVTGGTADQSKTVQNVTRNTSYSFEQVAGEGDLLRYRLRITNIGSQPLVNYNFEDNVTDVLRYATINLASVTDGGTLEAVGTQTVLRWRNITVNPYETKDVFFEATVKNQGQFTGSDQRIDNIFGNPTGVIIELPNPLIAVVKTGVLNPVPNNTGTSNVVRWTIHITNNGPIPLVGIKVNDTFHNVDQQYSALENADQLLQVDVVTPMGSDTRLTWNDVLTRLSPTGDNTLRPGDSLSFTVDTIALHDGTIPNFVEVIGRDQ